MTRTFTYTTNAPEIARLVHFVQRGSADGAYARRCAPGLVVETETGPDGNRVHGRDESGGPLELSVNLTVFAPQGGMFPQLAVKHALPDGRRLEPGTWHWHTECPDHTPPREVRVP